MSTYRQRRRVTCDECGYTRTFTLTGDSFYLDSGPGRGEAPLVEAMLDAGWLVSPDGYRDLCPRCAADQEAG